jgi:1,4-dihydroxy-2-naphthoate octaprenyltransferase
MDAFAAGPALAAALGALLLQVGSNFANDVFDAEQGADTGERIGPPRAVAMGWLSPSQMRVAMGLAFGAAVLVGLYLLQVAGWPIFAVGLVSILAGYAYTGGPWPLAYHGLGEATVFLFFGMVAVCGTVFVQSLAVSPVALVATTFGMSTATPQRASAPSPCVGGARERGRSTRHCSRSATWCPSPWRYRAGTSSCCSRSPPCPGR